MEIKKRRKGIVIMGRLIGLVAPLLPIMCIAVLLGVIGYLCAIFLTILAGYGLLQRLPDVWNGTGSVQGAWGYLTEMPGMLAAVLVILAVLRGIFRYGEQYCNHFIAFKLLASMLFFLLWNYQRGNVSYDRMLIAVIAMMGSFGPVVALANLSNNLNQTLASGERVLALLEEEPQVEETDGKEETVFEGAAAEKLSFGYGEEQVLKNYSLELPKGKLAGIHGASGSGKSTLLKLFMRFWDADSGQVLISGKNTKEINTSDLRGMEAYVTQETYLFHDSIANNIGIGKQGASREEIMEAAKKASVHDFIMTLPDGYDTRVGELGDTLSGGERQRIGIARAFLHDAPFLLLDEPTSNLDSLNEGIILKSLREVCQDKTVVLVSHRKSTMNAADVIFEMDNERCS